VTKQQSRPTLADRGTNLGLRLLTHAGSLPVLDNPKMRKRVERFLYNSTRQGLRAETVARKTFKKVSGGGSPARSKTVKPKDLFDLTPSDDQQMIQEAARELASTVLRPAATDADAARVVPDSVKEQAAELGLTLLGVPDALGGIAEERSAVTGVLVVEELAHGDIGLAAALLAPAAVASAIANYGSADQQATYLPAFTEEDQPPHAALAIQEPQPLFDALAPRTTGTIAGDHLTLNGTKALVANAPEAALFVVSALVDGVARLVIVEPGTKGLTTEEDPAMGIRAAATSRLNLENVIVPKANLLGTAEDHVDAVRRARLAWAAAAVGGAQAALDQLIPYVKERTAFGEPIAYRQAVAFTISDIAIELDGLRLVVLRAASRLDAGQDASQQIAHARALAANYAAQIGSHAVQLLGGHGYVKEYPNERWYRDLRGTGVLEGTLLV
jgi:alkylation response protein AidB-like acyl-CoA dehydrogenase